MPNKTLPLTSECMNTYSGRQTHASLAFKCVVVSPLLCVHRLTTWSPAGLHYTDMWDTSSHLWHKPLHQQSVNWTVTIETMVVGRTEPWCTVFLRLLGPCCHMYRSCSPAGNKSLAMRQDAWSFIPLTLPPAPLNPLGVDLWPLASDQTKQADTPPPSARQPPIMHGALVEHLLGGWMTVRKWVIFIVRLQKKRVTFLSLGICVDHVQNILLKKTIYMQNYIFLSV